MTIIVLGSTGFLGTNLKCFLISKKVTAFYATRSLNVLSENEVYFDLTIKSTWNNLKCLRPSLIINCMAYGVIKNELDLRLMYDVNYFLVKELYLYLKKYSSIFWVQVGTAFEYDLSYVSINESTPCIPNTHYGASKFLMSNFLFKNVGPEQYIVLRPFGMFGPREENSKIFPMLINAQLFKDEISLSPGTQSRDYFHVADFVKFICEIILNFSIKKYPNLINIGSCKSLTIIEYSEILSTVIADYNSKYWIWGSQKFRPDDIEIFYSDSRLCFEFGFSISPLEDGFRDTFNFYKYILANEP